MGDVMTATSIIYVQYSYKASPLPYLGASDHLQIILNPAHHPLKTVTSWPEGADHQLQDCFESTN